VQSERLCQTDGLQTCLFLRATELHHIKDMSDLCKVVVNNTEKGERDNLPKVRSRDRPFVNIRTPFSSGDRGGESTEDRTLRRSGTPQGQPSAVQQHAWSA
jgi:hypothetical protein